MLLPAIKLPAYLMAAFNAELLLTHTCTELLTVSHLPLLLVAVTAQNLFGFVQAYTVGIHFTVSSLWQMITAVHDLLIKKKKQKHNNNSMYNATAPMILILV